MSSELPTSGSSARHADALRALFRSALHVAGGADGGQLDALHASVSVYTESLKAEGLPPERVIIALKRLIETAHPPHRTSRLAEPSPVDQRALMDSLVTRCIKAYYCAD